MASRTREYVIRISVDCIIQYIAFDEQFAAKCVM